MRKKALRNGEGNGRDGSSVKACDSTKSCRQKPTQTYPSPSRSLSSTAVDNESTITTTAYKLASTPATPISSNCGCPCHKPGTTPSPLRLGESIAESRVKIEYTNMLLDAIFGIYRICRICRICGNFPALAPSTACL